MSVAQIYFSLWSDTKKQNILLSVNLVFYNKVKVIQSNELGVNKPESEALAISDLW